MSRNRVLSSLSIVIVALSLILFLSSCGSKSVSAPVSFDGTWESTGDVKMVATIHGDNIKIDWVMDEATTGLYWLGTFPTPESKLGKLSIASVGDVQAMDYSIVGSKNTAKIFTYKNGALSFEFTVMGTTSRISLTK